MSHGMKLKLGLIYQAIESVFDNFCNESYIFGVFGFGVFGFEVFSFGVFGSGVFDFDDFSLDEIENSFFIA